MLYLKGQQEPIRWSDTLSASIYACVLHNSFSSPNERYRCNWARQIWNVTLAKEKRVTVSGFYTPRLTMRCANYDRIQTELTGCSLWFFLTEPGDHKYLISTLFLTALLQFQENICVISECIPYKQVVHSSTRVSNEISSSRRVGIPSYYSVLRAST